MLGIERARVYGAAGILGTFVELLGILLMVGGIIFVFSFSPYGAADKFNGLIGGLPGIFVIYCGYKLEEWAKEKKHEEDVAASRAR